MYDILTLLVKIFNETIFLSLKGYHSNDSLKLWGIILVKSFECEVGIETLNSPKSWKDIFEMEKSSIYCLKIEAVKALVKLTSLFANNPNSY